MEKTLTFRDLGLSENVLAGLDAKGFKNPTPIQALCIPLLLKGGKSIVGQARTGTGKTAAFGLPIIEMVKTEEHYVQAIILTPTRELAVQVCEEIHSLRGTKNIRTLAVYGGQPIYQQLQKLRDGAHIVVGTPGRVIDHLHRGTLKLDRIQFFILDEADEMLNMGFIDDIEEIFTYAPKEKNMLLFSATMPPRILGLAQKYMPGFQHVKVQGEVVTGPVIDQVYYEVGHSSKFEALVRIISIEPEFYGIIFCRTRVDTEHISQKLNHKGFDSEPIHGDVSQSQRERVLAKFKSKKIKILVATDVAARGIDVNDLTHVVNFSLPDEPESYVHRIGRTARAGKKGTAITLISSSEYRKLLFIQRITNVVIRKMKLPEIQELIRIKKDIIKKDIEGFMADDGHKGFIPFAEEIAQGRDPMEVIASFLQKFFKDELDERNYEKIETLFVPYRREEPRRDGPRPSFRDRGSGGGRPWRR